MPIGHKTTKAERKRILRLARKGLSCRTIAARVKLSRSTVSRVCKAEGHAFGSANVEAAAAANRAYGAQWRAAKVKQLEGDFDHLREELFSPCTAHSFGGRDNTYNDHELERPTFRDQRDIVQAMATVVKAMAELQHFEMRDAGDLGAVDEFLTRMKKGGP